MAAIIRGYNIEHIKPVLEKGHIAISLLGGIPTVGKQARRWGWDSAVLHYIEKSLNKSTFKMEVYIARLLYK